MENSVVSLVIKNAEKEDIQTILEESPIGCKSFTYYNKRGYEVLHNHVVTRVLMHDENPVGYYHIDKDQDKYWFGILIKDANTGKGLSKILLDDAVAQSYSRKIDLHLSVYKSNSVAYRLYKKYNFFVVKETDMSYIMKRGWSKNG